MIKNLFLIVTFLVFFNFAGHTQCTPNPIYTTIGLPGIFPTPTEGIGSGIDSSPYLQEFTVIVPIDTTIVPSDYFIGAPSTPVSLTINSSTVNSITGLPAGLAYTCSISSCIFPGGSTSCFSIDGTPTQNGTFALQVNVTVNIDVPAFPPLPALGAQDLPAQNIDYSLTIDPMGTFIFEKINLNSFKVFPVRPTPSNGNAEIIFSAPKNQEINLMIHNMIGGLIISKHINSEPGINSISIDTGNLSPGIYMITLDNGIYLTTQKMVIGA